MKQSWIISVLSTISKNIDLEFGKYIVVAKTHLFNGVICQLFFYGDDEELKQIIR